MRMRMWKLLLILTAAAAVGICCAGGETVLSVSHVGDIVGYDSNCFAVNAPEPGTLTVTIGDGLQVFRTLRETVTAGAHTIEWDGLRQDGQRIGNLNGPYRAEAHFLTDSGKETTISFDVNVGKVRQALLFALPSSERLYQGGGQDWFCEICLVRAGNVVMQVYREESPNDILYTRTQEVKNEEPYKFRWNGKDQKGPLPAGKYCVRYFAEKNEDYDTVVAVELTDEAAPVRETAVTGPLLPSWDADDKVVWTVMQQPSAVVDIQNTSHQKVYAGPDTRARNLGTLHGQSQCLNVLAVMGDWALITAWEHEDGAQITGFVPMKNLKTVEPNPHWGLLINKKTQTARLYEDGKRIAEFPVSTGLAAKDKLIRETAAGSFLTDEHMLGFTQERQRYDYPIRYDGGNLIHQIGWRQENRIADFTEQRTALGTKASHGCVRLPDYPADDSGVDAYWLWTHLPWHTRIIILDDPEERAREQASVTGKEVPVQSVCDRLDFDTQPAEDRGAGAGETELGLTLGGDAVIGVRENWWKKEEALPAYLDAYGYGYPFSGLKEIFERDDMTFVNLECVLKADKSHERTDKQFRFRGLPAWTQVLSEGSVEQVNIANNHYIDYQSEGKRATRDALKAGGIPYSGYGYGYVWEKDGVRIGFAGIRETIYLQNKGQIYEDIAALRDEGCDVVVYSCHWGQEYAEHHNELQEEMALAAVQAGADLVVGTHPHVVQGISVIGHTPVIWSLGNLMFGGTIEMTVFDAILANVRLRFENGVYLGCAISLTPILTSGMAADGVNDYRPIPAQGEDSERILRSVQLDSGIQLMDTMWFPVK